MSRTTFGRKKYRKDDVSSRFYFGLKSKNEIYFQMASIFKAGSSDEDKLAKNIFNDRFIADASKNLVEIFF